MACGWGVNWPVRPHPGLLNHHPQAQTTGAGAGLVQAGLHQDNGHQCGQTAVGEGTERTPFIPIMAAICPTRTAAEQQPTPRNAWSVLAVDPQAEIEDRAAAEVIPSVIRPGQPCMKLDALAWPDLPHSHRSRTLDRPELWSRRVQTETGREGRLRPLLEDHG